MGVAFPYYQSLLCYIVANLFFYLLPFRILLLSSRKVTSKSYTRFAVQVTLLNYSLDKLWRVDVFCGQSEDVCGVLEGVVHLGLVIAVEGCENVAEP